MKKTRKKIFELDVIRTCNPLVTSLRHYHCANQAQEEKLVYRQSSFTYHIYIQISFPGLPEIRSTDFRFLLWFETLTSYKILQHHQKSARLYLHIWSLFLSVVTFHLIHNWSFQIFLSENAKIMITLWHTYARPRLLLDKKSPPPFRFGCRGDKSLYTERHFRLQLVLFPF